MNYEGLLDEAYNLNLIVKEAEFLAYKGRIKGNRIAIKKDIPTLKEKSCVLAEEIAHYHLTVGDITDQNITENRKQEHKARLQAYNRQVGLIGIINAYEAGCTNIFEIAEYLNVTEDFLNETLNCYRSKYGVFAEIDNYIIYFEPNLQVLKFIQ